ncbi:hypothetical protein V1508DRAFT_423174 [Lipomyces doorenjongii]|uniref:uncharacterized protein n=1 Tax=Lipomyces doorenjongii TaxID=383834 RepID=UPI0034CF4B47
MFKQIFVIMLLLGLSVAQSMDCIGQGEGSCQFTAIQSEAPETDANTVVTLYDHACNVIGTDNSASTGDVIDSQLPYTVDVLYLGFNPQFGAVFNYAAGQYGLGVTSYVNWDCSQGLVGCSGFRSAFPCPGF